MRIVACGHTYEHMPHWMQTSGSHSGICMPILRFSYCVVAVGNLPSTGHLAYGQRIAATGHDFGRYGLHEFRSIGGNHRRHLDLAGYLIGILDFKDLVQSAIDGGVVHLRRLFRPLRRKSS